MQQRENLTSADNQQERSKEYIRGYVTGLVDSEGSFHVAFQMRPDLPLGVSIIPEFHVSQNEESMIVLELTKKLLGCGYIKPNHRNSKDRTFVYVVRDRIDLMTKVIPFFEINTLQTSKKNDFALFAQIVRFMQLGVHRNSQGVKEIIRLAYQMNGGGSRRIRTERMLLSSLKSSETIRKTPL